MTLYYIDKDEWWPVFTIVTDPFNYEAVIELTDEQHAEYLDVMDKFKQWQARLAGKIED